MSKIFAKRLKQEREAKGWAQEYMSSLLGISNGTLSGYERNYREPDFDVLTKICAVLNCTTDYLLGLTDTPRPNDPQKAEDANGLDLVIDAHKDAEYGIKSLTELEALIKRILKEELERQPWRIVLDKS